MDRGERRRRTDAVIERRKRDVIVRRSGLWENIRGVSGRLRKCGFSGCRCNACRRNDSEHSRYVNRKAPAADVDA